MTDPRESQPFLALQQVLAEHHRGRPLAELLDDPRLAARLTVAQRRQLAEHPELLDALVDELAAEQLAARLRPRPTPWRSPEAA